MWRRIWKVARSLPVLIIAGLYALYLLFGFFLVDPLARRLLPWAGDKMLASRLEAERVDFNPFTLELRVHGLKLAQPDGALLAGFDQLYLNLETSGLARWAWRIKTLEVDGPRAQFKVGRDGSTNWSALIARLQQRAGPPSNTIPRVLIDHIRVSDGDILYVDGNRPGEPYQASLKPLGIEIDAISTLPEDSGDYLLTARMPDQGATLRWKGTLALNPLLSEGDLAVEGGRLDRLVRAVPTPLSADVAGTLGAQLHYRFAMVREPQKQDVPSLVVTRAQVQVKDFALAPRGGREPLLQVPRAQVTDVSFDSLQQHVVVGAVNLEGGKVAAKRDAHGAQDWDALFAAAPADPPGDGHPSAGAPWKVDVHDIHLAGWSANLRDETRARPLAATVEGVDVKGALTAEFGAITKLVLGPVNVAAGPVQLMSADEPVAQLQRLALENVNVQQPGNRIRADALTLSGPSATIALDKQQQLNWVDILRTGGEEQQAAVSAGRAAVAVALPDLRVARVSVDDIALRLEDASTAKPVALDLTDGKIALTDVGLDMTRAIPVEASISVRQGGRLEARGSIVPAAPSGKMDVRLAGLALQPFAPYVHQFARLVLKDGTVATHGKVAFAPGKSGLALTYTGGFAVDELAITEEDTGDAFLGWDKLSSDNLVFTLAPNALRIGELVAVSPVGKVVIFEDRSLNLQRIRRTEAPTPSATVPVAATATATASAASVDFPMSIERVRITGADAQFADLSLTPQFGARMHDLEGTVTGLTTDPAASAEVELDGKVNDYGSVRVRGTIQPFHATAATDLTLAFHNLDMTRLTPYSGKFAGRKIDSGHMSVDLEYKIKERQLAGTNKFIINQLKLGQRVDSPDAMKLPLDLAIALLQDSNGVINVDLPVTGSLDDPQFSYGAIVWKAIVNVLTKIVTAPFRALGSLLGGDSEKMQAIGFDPGSTVLLPPELEKLKTLADALAKRPALTLTIQPGYDPDADRRALQAAEMRRQAAEVAGMHVGPDEKPGPVDVNNYKVQTWLEDRYAAQAGKDDYEKLRTSFQDKNASTAARVKDTEFIQRLGRNFGTRDSGPPSTFHAELLERLTRQVPIADDALVALAQARAKVLSEAIVQEGLDAARVSVGGPIKQAEKDQQVACGLTLGAGEAPAPTAPPTARLGAGDASHP